MSLDSQLLMVTLSRIQDWLKAETVNLPVHLRGTVGQRVNALFHRFLMLTYFLYLITHMTNSHLVNVREAVPLLHIRRKQRTVHHQLPVPLLSASKLYWVLHHLQSCQDLLQKRCQVLLVKQQFHLQDFRWIRPQFQRLVQLMVREWELIHMRDWNG